MLIQQGKTNWIYVLIVIVLAVIVGGGILGYQYWWLPRQYPVLPEAKLPEKVTKDETAGWKTYRNEEYGFEIKYFADWEIAEYFSSSPIGGPFISTSIKQQSLPIRINIKKDFEKSYILEKYPDFPEEWASYAGCSMNILTSANIDEDFNKNFEKECQQYKTKDVEVGGSNAIKCEPGTGPAVWSAVWLLKNNKAIAFIFSSLAPEDCEGMFNQMLSTFKFLE